MRKRLPWSRLAWCLAAALLTLIGFRFAWKQPFFKLAEPDDFLKAIKTN